MALENDGTKTYARISDLPLINDIRDGDKLIVHTPGGDSLIDFMNLIIPLDNVSFRDQFKELWKYFDANSGLIDKIGATQISVTDLAPDKQTLSDAVNQLSNSIAACTAALNALTERVAALENSN